MMGFMMFLIVLIVFGRIAGRILGETERTERFRRRRLRRHDEKFPGPPAQALPPQRVETPVEALQRRFAQGEITVEEYEREVGKVFGVRQSPDR